jgi:hypothetical protein
LIDAGLAHVPLRGPPQIVEKQSLIASALNGGLPRRIEFLNAGTWFRADPAMPQHAVGGVPKENRL